MVDDSFYYGELNKLALSSSAIKLLTDSPNTYKFVTNTGNKETSALREGKLVHWAILEPQKFSEQIFVNVSQKSAKAYKEAKAKYGEVYTRTEKEYAERITDHFLRNEYALKCITNCEFEIPNIGMIGGYPFRCKADIVSEKGIIDIKTTTSKVKNWHYDIDKYSYDVQLYIYCTIFKIPPFAFKFLVINKKNLEIGYKDGTQKIFDNGKRKTELALKLFEKYFINGEDLDNRIIKIGGD
jgi:hypothetical protein